MSYDLAAPESGRSAGTMVRYVLGGLLGIAVPGGLGIVEGSLAVILAAYGTGRVPAISAALAYRLVSFWLSVAVGWVSVAAIAHQTRRKASATLHPRR